MDGNLLPASHPLHATAIAAPAIARVVEAESGMTVLTSAGARLAVRRATNCLIEPAVGDLVLTVGTGEDVFVLAVLERPSGAPAVLSVPGASTVTLAQEQISLRCRNLTVDAGTATLRSRVAQVAGRTVKAVADGLDVVARTLRRTAEQEFSHAKNAVRTVEGAETVTAGELTLEAKTALAQRAGIVLVDAAEDVRINGERITMG